ncbi:TonB-dependent receptor [Acetobacteraceae bacterium]|nr:TonB-dependent receptor [Acetobacteraceae bacterium]
MFSHSFLSASKQKKVLAPSRLGKILPKGLTLPSLVTGTLTSLLFFPHPVRAQTRNPLLDAYFDSVKLTSLPKESLYKEPEEFKPHKQKRHGHHPKPDPEHIGVSRVRKKKILEPVSHSNEDLIGQAQMENFAEGTNPLEVLALTTPGANFNSSDALGTDPQANTFLVRGFFQNQMGVTMDGIPLGLQTFSEAQGVPYSNIAIPENTASLALSQGTGDVDIPTASMLGASIQYQTMDPTDRPEAAINQQFGSFNSWRTFGRFNTGRLNHTGTKMMASFVRLNNHQWTGAGQNNQYYMNFKAVQPLGRNLKLTLGLDWSQLQNWNYLGNTKHMLRSLGYGDHNLMPDYAGAINWAGMTQNPPTSGGLVPNNLLPTGLQGRGVTYDDISNVVYQGNQTQSHYLPSLKLDWNIRPTVKSTTILYSQLTAATSGGSNNAMTTPAAYTGTGYSIPMAGQYVYPNHWRSGFTQTLEARLNRRMTIKTGVWYQNILDNYPSYAYPDGGMPPANPLHPTGGIQYMNTKVNTNTFQFFLQSKFSMTKNFDFTYGFKSLVQKSSGGTQWDNATTSLNGWGSNGGPMFYTHPANGSLEAANAFLPHFNIDYRFLEGHDFYADIGEDMRGYDTLGGSAWSGLGSCSPGNNPACQNNAQTIFNQDKQNLRPERSWNYVVGYRYTSKAFVGVIDYYHTDFINRLGSMTSGPVSNPIASYANLGNEKMDGMDFNATFMPMEFFHISPHLGHISFSNGFSYNHAIYENSHLACTSDPVCPASGFISIKGNQQVYYPQYMYKMNLNYKLGGFMTNLNVNYNSSRQLTYANDLSLPGYWTSTLESAYVFQKAGPLQGLKFSFNVSNLFQQKYVGAIYGGTASLSGDNNPNLYWAQPRAYFGSVSFNF